MVLPEWTSEIASVLSCASQRPRLLLLVCSSMASFHVRKPPSQNEETSGLRTFYVICAIAASKRILTLLMDDPVSPANACIPRNSAPTWQSRTPIKPLLYVYRVLLTGIHLMRTGLIEANLVTLNEEFRLPYLRDLVARKLAGPEKSKLEDADIAFHESEYQRLRGELQAAHDDSQLPELPSEKTRAALNDLLVRVRLRAR